MRKIILLLTLISLTAFADDAVIVRGAALPKDTEVVPLASVLAKPEAYSKDAVLVEGEIVASCTEMGCWMQLAPAKGQPSVRVTFKDEAFVIPLEAKGMKARAEGVTMVKELSKEEVDHLTGEGAKITRRADGTAVEVSFLANGVELRK
jgi:hypothetical protein